MDLSKRSASQIEEPEEGPSSIKRKPGHPRRIVDHWDATKKKDAEITYECEIQLPEEISTTRDAWPLLVEIVKASPEKLNQKYAANSKAAALVKETPGLLDALKNAWSEKCYKNIRNLGSRP